MLQTIAFIFLALVILILLLIRFRRSRTIGKYLGYVCGTILFIAAVVLTSRKRIALLMKPCVRVYASVQWDTNRR